MGRDEYMDPSEQLRMAYTKSACLELLALSKNYRQVMPQVLEVLRKYFAAEKACFFEYEKYENAGNNGNAEEDIRKVLAEDITVYIDQKNYSEYLDEKTLIHQYIHCMYPRSGSISLADKSSWFTAPVCYEKRNNGVLLVKWRNDVQKEVSGGERNLLSEIANALGAEIQKCRYQEYLLRLSFSDQLTGVKNHTSYIRMRKRIQKYPVQCGVGFADLNGLKYVNDTFGHEYGDKVLVRLAEVMKQYFPEDQIYRISGDEFIVLCPEIEQELFLDCSETLKKRLKQEEHGLAAFGYIWNDGSKDIAELLRLAEQDMYEEKCLYYQHNERRETVRPLYADELLSIHR